MNESLILKLARLAAALVVVLVFGRGIAHALWTAVVWLAHYPTLGAPVLVILFVFVPILIGAALEDRESAR